VDPEEEVTDLHLPGTGTIAQASLLLLEQLVERLRPKDPGHSTNGGRLVIGVAVPDGLVQELLAELVREYGQRSNWQRGYVEDQHSLREAVLDVLIRMRLVARVGSLRFEGQGLPEGYEGAVPEGRPVTDVTEARAQESGLVLLAAAARYATHITVRKASGPRPDADVEQELPL
jgi:hypothetical protein